MKDLEVFNNALLSKWKCRCFNDKKAMWRGLLEHKYGNLSYFACRDSPSCSRKDSIWWRFLAAITMFSWKVSAATLVGGVEVSFWKHQWIGKDTLYLVFPKSLVVSENKNDVVADLVYCCEGVWNWKLI